MDLTYWRPPVACSLAELIAAQAEVATLGLMGCLQSVLGPS
jgi:hypothetical protein